MYTCYNDDAPKFADCVVEPASLRSWAEALVRAGRMEAANHPTALKLLGTWSPRKALEQMKEYATVREHP